MMGTGSNVGGLVSLKTGLIKEMAHVKKTIKLHVAAFALDKSVR